MLRRFLQDDGSLTVEASISMTFFTLVMVCIIMFINVGRAQMKLQLAANKSAQQIAQYMYLVKISGLYNVKTSINGSGGKFVQTTANAEQNVNKALDALDALVNKVEKTKNGYTSGTISLADPTQAVNQIKDLVDTGKNTASTVKTSYEGLSSIVSSIADNPVGFIKTIGAFFVDGALNEMNSRLFGQAIGGALVKKSLGGDDADAFLKNLNVDRGLEGLDLSQSVIFQPGHSANGAQDVNIVIIYKVNVLPLLNKNIKATFAVSASTRAWLGGDELNVRKFIK